VKKSEAVLLKGKGLRNGGFVNVSGEEWKE
jgi:hypothetical protein